MTNKDTPTAEQLVRTQLEYITESPTPMYGDNTSNIETICESYLSLLEKNQWWESHMGNTIPEEYRQWGCDSAKMMSEEIAELKAQLKIAKEALEYYQHKDLQNGTSKILSRAYQILSKLTI